MFHNYDITASPFAKYKQKSFEMILGKKKRRKTMKPRYKIGYYMYHYDKLAEKLAWLKTQAALCDYTEYYPYPDRRRKSMYYHFMFDRYNENRLQLRELIEKKQKGNWLKRFFRCLRGNK